MYLTLSATCVIVLYTRTVLCEAEPIRSLLCRKCGETILNSNHLQHFASRLSIANTSQAILGKPSVPVQLFENPHKQKFSVVTAKSANINAQEQAIADATWFPGYAWRISVCPQCHQHLGWKFQPINFNHVTHTEDETFVALILDKLLEEELSNSLLLVPKSYNS